MLTDLPLYQQMILTLAAMVLFTAFVLLAQTRITSIIDTYAWQGALVALTTALVAFDSDQPHLYLSAVLTFSLKALFIPWLLHSMVILLNIGREPHRVDHPFAVLLLASGIVLFCYYIVLPIQQLAAHSITRNVIAVSMSVVLLGLLMLITRKKAVTQVVGFMSLENGLFFSAVAATHGMPMVVELGIAFDVLIAAVISSIFFFHIRDSIDSLDVGQMHKLSEGDVEGDKT